MVRLTPSARTLAIVAGMLSALIGTGRPALADDNLTVIAGATPTAFFEVLGDVAERAGFYKEQHLVVDVQYAGSPNVATQLVASGKGDICSIATEPIILGYEKGIRMTAFFSRDPHYEWVLAVPADSPIKTLSDFKGKTLGEYSVGSPAEISTNSMLMGAGLKKSDVSYEVIGGGAQAVVSITGNKVDGVADPFVELAIYETVAHLKFRYFYHPILKDIGDVAYVATQATIASKADALRRFSRANAEAAILIRENPQLAARYFLDVSKQKVTDQALADETRLLQLSQDQLPGFDPTSKKIGLLSTHDMVIYTKWLADNGYTSQVVPASSVVTDQFIDFANDFDHKALIEQTKNMR
jgi:NitT/TauT family transport system substrate-binding protein